jgi:hypothetical protein
MKFRFLIRDLLWLTVVVGGKCGLLTLLALSAEAGEPKWGDLKLRFVYDGEPPKSKLLAVPAGVPFAPVDETWVVNPKNKGVANVVFYLDYQRGEALDVHPDVKEPAEGQISVGIVKHRFDPHVSIIRTDQTLVVTNADPIGHVVKGDFGQNDSFNVLLAPGEKTELTFRLPERSPGFLSDSIHTSLNGYLLTCNHPYFAKADENGDVVIRKLAVGKHTFRGWHEGVGMIRAPIQNGKPLKWERALLDVEIKEGENDLGEFAIKQRAR